jgi:transcriptional regulator with XRE-family HTH domain
VPNKSSVPLFPERLFQARNHYEGKVGGRLTDVAFAEMMGVSQPTVSDWKNGNRYPDLVQTEKMARVLGVSAGWLGFAEGTMLAGHHPPAKPMPPERLEKVESKKKGAR